MLTPVEYRRKQLEYKNRVTILENCKPVIRNLITKAVVERPTDVLDYMAKLLSEMRGVALEEVEKSVVQKVKDKGLLADDRKYKSQKDIEEQLRLAELREISPSREDHDSQSRDQLIRLPSGQFGTGLYSAASKDDEYQNQDYDDDDGDSEDFSPRRHHNIKQRILRRMNDSFALRNLTSLEKEVVVARMKEVKYKNGETVIKQGEEGDTLYVVDEGELKCFKKYLGETEEVLMREYGPGDTFGE